MSATADVVTFPRAGTKLLARDRRLLDGLAQVQHRLDVLLEHIDAGRIMDARALCMIANMECSELEGVVLGEPS